MPALGQRSPSCLTVCFSPLARRAPRTTGGTWTGRPPPVQVLGVVVGGQHFHAVGQRGSEVNGVLGAEATADAEPSVGNLPTDQLGPNTTVLARASAAEAP